MQTDGLLLATPEYNSGELCDARTRAINLRTPPHKGCRLRLARSRHDVPLLSG